MSLEKDLPAVISFSFYGRELDRQTIYKLRQQREENEQKRRNLEMEKLEQQKRNQENGRRRQNHSTNNSPKRASHYPFNCTDRDQSPGFFHQFLKEGYYKQKYYPQYDKIQKSSPAYTIFKQKYERKISPNKVLQSEVDHDYNLCRKNPLVQMSLFRQSRFSEEVQKTSNIKQLLKMQGANQTSRDVSPNNQTILLRSTAAYTQRESSMKQNSPRGFASKQNSPGKTSLEVSKMQTNAPNSDRNSLNINQIDWKILSELELKSQMENQTQRDLSSDKKWVQFDKQVPRNTEQRSISQNEDRFCNYKDNSLMDPRLAHPFDSYPIRKEVFAPKHTPEYNLLDVNYDRLLPRNFKGDTQFHKFSSKIPSKYDNADGVLPMSRLDYYPRKEQNFDSQVTRHNPQLKIEKLTKRPDQEKFWPNQNFKLKRLHQTFRLDRTIDSPDKLTSNQLQSQTNIDQP